MRRACHSVCIVALLHRMGCERVLGQKGSKRFDKQGPEEVFAVVRPVRLVAIKPSHQFCGAHLRIMACPLQEFITAAMDRKRALTKETLTRVFSELDDDNDGELGPRVFCTALQVCARPLPAHLTHEHALNHQDPSVLSWLCASAVDHGSLRLCLQSSGVARRHVARRRGLIVCYCMLKKKSAFLDQFRIP